MKPTDSIPLILEAMTRGDYIYVEKRAPRWWPWRTYMYLGEFPNRFYISRKTFQYLMESGYLMDWGETWDLEIWNISEVGRGLVPEGNEP